MDVASNAWHVIAAGIVFLFGAGLALALARRFGVPQRRAVFLYLWHTAFSLAYMMYTLANVADATIYYLSALNYSGSFAIGTNFVTAMTWVLVRVFGLSYVGCFLVFNVIGFVGLLVLYGILRIQTRDKSVRVRRVAFLVVLLPSINFWTSALGKDAISFLAVALFIWGAAAGRFKVGWYAAAILTMLLVRPHMAAVMLVAIVLSVLLGRRMGALRRVLLGGAVIVASVALIPFSLDYAGMGDVTSLSDVGEYIDTRQGFNQEGGGGVDISTMDPVSQLFTYMFRPLPHEARSVAMAASSVDNVALLLFTLAGIYFGVRQRFIDLSANRLVLWFYSLPALVLLATTTANLGISVRQKWMVAPVFMYLLITMIPARRVSQPAKPPVVQISGGREHT